MLNSKLESIAENLSLYLATKENSYLENFYHSLYPLAYKISLLITKNVADAEDVAQTSFYTVFNQVETCQALKEKNNEKVRSWFLSIVYNHSKVVLRTRRRNKNKEKGQKEISLHKGNSPKMSNYLENEMKFAINRLDEKYRIPIILKYQDGLNSSEMSEILKINEVTLRVRIKRGLEKVRGMLVKDQNEFEKLLPTISLISFENNWNIQQVPKYANKDVLNIKSHLKQPKFNLARILIAVTGLTLSSIIAILVYKNAKSSDFNYEKKSSANELNQKPEISKKINWDLTKGNKDGIKVIKGNWDFENDGMVTTGMKEPFGTLISLPIKTSKYFKLKFNGKIEFDQKSEASPFVVQGVLLNKLEVLAQDLIYKKEFLRSLSFKDVKKEYGLYTFHIEAVVYFTSQYISTSYMSNNISQIAKVKKGELYDEPGIFIRDVKIQNMEYEPLSEDEEKKIELEILKIINKSEK